MTYGAKNGGSFSEMMGPSTVDIWVVYFTYTQTLIFICILTADDTVKPVFSGHSKKKNKNWFPRQIMA